MTQPLQNAGISRRFLATLAANLIRGGLSFAGSVITARSLGASSYGGLMFLLGGFVAVNQLLDMGTSSAFYTFISSRKRGRTFLTMYGGWITFQLVAVVVAIALLFPDKLVAIVWLGQDRWSVLLAFGVAYMMNQAWGTVSQLGEASRKTVLVQYAAIAQAVAHFGLVAGLAYSGRLSVRAVLWLLIIEYLLISAVCGPRWVRDHLKAADDEDARTVAREFARYCRPLAAYAWLGFLYAFADRWMLQRAGGAVQQGFFSVGQQFAAVSLIATTSILKVFWKEIAEAKERGNQQRMQTLYRVVSRSLYFTGAWISCLLIPYSKEILRWTAGPGYAGAWICMAVMLVYPVHQALGQTQGAFFYASSDTRSYALIGAVSMAVSIPLTYFMVAPRSAMVGGLALGALGIALKLVAVQMVGVNVQAYIIARRHGWAYDYKYQAVVLVGLLGLSWGLKAAVQRLFQAFGFQNAMGVLVVAGLIYCLLSLRTLYLSPWLAGLTTADLERAVSSATGWKTPHAAAA